MPADLRAFIKSWTGRLWGQEASAWVLGQARAHKWSPLSLTCSRRG